MAFNADYLSVVAYPGGKGGQKLWQYITTDNNAAVTATDYFAAPSIGERQYTVGDQIHVSQITTLPNTGPATDFGIYQISVIDSDGNATVIAGVAMT